MTILLLTFLSLLLLNIPAWAFDEVHLKKLQALGHCPKCDLSQTNLTQANLTGATMKHVKLDRAILCKTQTPWGEDNSGC